MKGNVIVVVPTIREDSIVKFLGHWRVAFRECKVIVVEDSPTRTFDLSNYSGIFHYSWEDIENELGEDAWIIPRRTDCIRSYGFYKAYLERPHMIVTLDDDCYPIDDKQTKTFFSIHWDRLFTDTKQEAWYSTVKGIVPRGVPYFNTERRWSCALNHGLWTGIPDLDAPSQLVNSRYQKEFLPINGTIPVGMYFPMCGMNLAFRFEIVPAFYFFLMGKDYPYDRFGDIWAGIFVKKICDHLGYSINSGEPFVRHDRASNVWANLRNELEGLQANEALWEHVDKIILTKTTFAECYLELSDKLNIDGHYWNKVKQAMKIWANLCISRASS